MAVQQARAITYVAGLVLSVSNEAVERRRQNWRQVLVKENIHAASWLASAASNSTACLTADGRAL